MRLAKKVADPKARKISFAGSRKKGNRFENLIAKALGGKRVPLSGSYKAAGREYSEDVVLPMGWRIQCKSEADGWRRFYALLQTADVVAVKADRRIPLIVLPINTFRLIYQEYAKNHGYDVPEFVDAVAEEEASE